MNDILVFDIARLGVKSILSTAAVYPKPGLVTPLDSLSDPDGATGSVDFQAVIDCAMALFPCFINCASIGNDTENLPPMDVLTLLEPVEIQGRREVDNVAQGRRVLKLHGEIFLIGLLCAAAGRLIAQKRNLTPKALALTASSFVRNLATRGPMSLSVPDGDATDIDESKGERYALYGVDGCLGEAERGFPLTLAAAELISKLTAAAEHHNEGTVFLQSSRERAAHALLRILAENPDANLAGTSGVEGLASVQLLARRALAAGGMFTIGGRDAIASMDHELRSKKIIPMGSQIVLSAALFVIDLGKLLSLH